ncbi:phytanoyl-CoA dioxygenase family protein [Luteimonas sp. MC1825]|uniref:phytanoyl-CoA dioxygenase family protein n=1 Tax=Luteimonas sp. MC1825 TaxID=2761107 RepID=UPI00160FBF45|nr:phytanoyl-CoA dioxygenase family protein [Luteimonas sp. MC1825]MBB6600002.1 phytanoyl-CoA dioxygenase family protein [Luteimonas sp. MC1825]QOC87705.1 phytanoyl-CoA dioxygenase family protein [Luteimonas sp. MC1825]
MELARFRDAIARDGYVLFEDLVPEPFLASLRRDIAAHVAACREQQRRNGLGEGMEGAAHHVVGRGDSLDAFLKVSDLDGYIRDFFDGAYILNSYGALNNLPISADTYEHGQRFHRDVRTFSGDFRLMLNMLVMVDDFTIKNGATRLVPGSHRALQRPDEAFLEDNAVQAVGRAGSVLLFDSNLWHSAAPNRTAGPRMALTLTFTRPFFKQQMDYPRLLGEDYTQDARMRQLLGYNARVPSSHDEWYQPPERRMYRPDQG